MAWSLSEAMERLPEVVERAESDGPQALEINGRERAVVVSAEHYRLMSERKPTFKEFLLSFPSLEGVDMSRNEIPARDIDL